MIKNKVCLMREKNLKDLLKLSPFIFLIMMTLLLWNMGETNPINYLKGYFGSLLLSTIVLILVDQVVSRSK